MYMFKIAGFYGRMIDHEYTSNDIFNKNFFHDWRKVLLKMKDSKWDYIFKFSR